MIGVDDRGGVLLFPQMLRAIELQKALVGFRGAGLVAERPVALGQQPLQLRFVGGDLQGSVEIVKRLLRVA